VFRTTVAFPLSAGSMVSSVLFLRIFSAALSVLLKYTTHTRSSVIPHPPAYEDWTDRDFRNVGYPRYMDTGDLPKRQQITIRTRRKFKIKNGQIINLRHTVKLLVKLWSSSLQFIEEPIEDDISWPRGQLWTLCSTCELKHSSSFSHFRHHKIQFWQFKR